MGEWVGTNYSNGRGERSRAGMSDELQTVRFVRAADKQTTSQTA